MSYETTRRTVDQIDELVRLRYEEGNPIALRVYGHRPRLLIHAFSPLVYEPYGLIRNRGPQLFGRFLLHAVLIAEQEESDGAVAYLGAQARDIGPAFGFTVQNPSQLNTIARQVGIAPRFVEA